MQSFCFVLCPVFFFFFFFFVCRGYCLTVVTSFRERFYFSYFGLWLCTVCHYLFTLHLGVNSTTYSLITTIPGHLLYYFCPKRIYRWTFQGGISVSSFSQVCFFFELYSVLDE